MNIITNSDGSINKAKLGGTLVGVAAAGGIIGWFFTNRYHARKAAELAEANETAIGELKAAIVEIRGAKRKAKKRTAPKTKRGGKRTLTKVTKALAGK